VPGMSVHQCVTRFLSMDIAPEIFAMPVRLNTPEPGGCHGCWCVMGCVWIWCWQEYVDQMRGYEEAGALSPTNLERVRDFCRFFTSMLYKQHTKNNPHTPCRPTWSGCTAHIAHARLIEEKEAPP
jgi:hypothetical protein